MLTYEITGQTLGHLRSVGKSGCPNCNQAFEVGDTVVGKRESAWFPKCLECAKRLNLI